MQIYLKEKIGNPDLFTGRRKELDKLLTWVEKIKPELSKSRAILSRRKTGKSAIMQRLFNIVFEQNDQVVPFYFEFTETSKWIADLAKDYFFTFIGQYLAFKTRNIEYMDYNTTNYKLFIEAAQKAGLDYLSRQISQFEHSEKKREWDILWDIARDTPRTIAQLRDERILQIIDEFQFINKYIFRDRACKNHIPELAGSYLHTAEYKHAPMLVSGSWIGWLMDDINKLLPGRFIFTNFGNMPKNEAIEMALNYSALEKIPLTYENACIIAELTEGNPFYISSLFQSEYSDKDFSTEKGILEVLDFETLDRGGGIRGTWMEYIGSAINRINDINGKKIILYICKKKDVTRAEIEKDLNLEMKNGELETRLKAFVRADIIEHGESDFDYRAVQDNIFDKVFRGVYQKEIDGFDHKQIRNEYKALYKKLQGEYNKYKGEYSEYVIINKLKYKAYKENDLYLSMMHNLPKDFSFVKYLTVWSYSASIAYNHNIQIDIFAKAKEQEYSIIGEVKNRKKKFSLKEAREFFEKAIELKKEENISKTLIFVFSSSGFYKKAIEFFLDNNIAWSEDKRFLLSGKESL